MLQSIYCLSHSHNVLVTKLLLFSFRYTPKLQVDNVLTSFEMIFLIFRNPATFLHAYTCLPLPYASRKATGTVLQDVCASGVLFALLMCRHKVHALVQQIKVFQPGIIFVDCMLTCRLSVLLVHRKLLSIPMTCFYSQILSCLQNHSGKC